MKLRVPPVVQVLLCGALAWRVAALFPTPQIGGSWRLFFAALVSGIGAILLSLAVSAFVRAKTTVNPLAPGSAEKLVTSGLFRFSRNPMYLGMLLVLAGWVIWLGTWPAILAPALFIWIMTVFQIKPEERSLQLKFGDQFTLYRTRTRRWI